MIIKLLKTAGLPALYILFIMLGGVSALTQRSYSSRLTSLTTRSISDSIENPLNPIEKEFLNQERASSSVIQLIVPEAGQPFSIINPCTDFGFKRAFKNPIVLADFLNNILDYKGGDQIVQLSYMDKEFASLDIAGRAFTVDIVCLTENQRYFLIEMQNDYGPDYADKSYVEFARFLAGVDSVKLHDLSMGGEPQRRRRIGDTDIEAQDFWKKIQEVCTVVISNKRFRPDFKKERFTDETVAEPDVINTYEMRHNVHANRHLGSLKAKVVLVMLANFHKTEYQLETMMDRWLFALKDESMATGREKINAFKVISDITSSASDSEALKRFYAGLHVRSVGKDILTDYEKEVKFINDRDDRKKADWKAEGRIEGEIEVMMKMRAAGMQDAEIARIVKLTEEQFQELMIRDS